VASEVVHPAVRVLAWVWTRLMNDQLRSRVMWWLNAKFAVGVSAIVRSERGEVLFVERPFRRCHPWGLPGGWIRRREALEGAVVRSVREETGLEVAVERTVAAHTFAVPRLNVAFLCRLQRGTPAGAVETSRLRWCPPDALPPEADPEALRLVRLGLGVGQGQGIATTLAPGASRSPAGLTGSEVEKR
jgi:8-oxo-dGTP diphosphatase